ncbi:hypothetical protein [Paenibacillus donghaensis]|uniref:Uncharacterized protein n=1 Tax=Paenibacillus donghaensis TaxID=414771 RepID=A0A2Z2KYS9_9BACL|nr:hypothetical protein [Paenibacillus donghaensis]ASA25798.1 hypothetical protein B9T62_36770 [Paenibacillus donghaensis]
MVRQPEINEVLNSLSKEELIRIIAQVAEQDETLKNGLLVNKRAPMDREVKRLLIENGKSRRTSLTGRSLFYEYIINYTCSAGEKFLHKYRNFLSSSPGSLNSCKSAGFSGG